MLSQYSRNLYTNIINLITNIVIGLLYTPYLVKSLGISAYGIIPLALIINQYILVITESLTGSLTRFYSISIQKKDYEEASKYLSTAFYVLIIVILLISPIFYLIVRCSNSIFNIAENNIYDAKILFSFTLMSFSISLFSSLFNITLYANNRLDFLNYIKITRNITKIITVVIFFKIYDENISLIGYANFISEIIVLIISVLLYKKTTDKNIKISCKLLNFYNLNIILIMTSWVVIQRIGDTTLYRIDNFIVNKLFGITYSAILGTITEFVSYITNIILVLSSIYGPLILIEYSKNNHNKIKYITNEAIYTIGTICSMIVGLVIAFSSDILSMWLGTNFSEYSIWLSIKIASLPFITSSIVFAYIFRSWNRIRIPAIITLLLGVINLLSSYLIFLIFGNYKFSINIILGTASVINILQSYIFNLWYLKKIYPDTNYFLYIKHGVKFIIIMILPLIISLILKLLFNSNNIINLLIIISITAISITIITWLFFTNKKTKEKIQEYFKRIKTHKFDERN